MLTSCAVFQHLHKYCYWSFFWILWPDLAVLICFWSPTINQVSPEIIKQILEDWTYLVFAWLANSAWDKITDTIVFAISQICIQSILFLFTKNWDDRNLWSLSFQSFYFKDMELDQSKLLLCLSTFCNIDQMDLTKQKHCFSVSFLFYTNL